jgi:energy-coupling factor transport system ATP-binding protein
VSVAFEGRPCLEGVDLELSPGRVGAVLGASGSGKSTLLRVLAGELEPDAGSVHLAGRRLAAVPGGAFPTIGYVMQRPERQFFARTVLDEVGFALQKLSRPPDEIAHRTRGALEAVGLDDASLLARAPWTLSRGQQRLVALASVLVYRPLALLVDEPVAGLDPRYARAVADALAGAARAGGASVLITARALDGPLPLEDVSLLNERRLIRLDLARGGEVGRLEEAGLTVPPAWRFLARRISGFWGEALWRDPIEVSARRLPGAPLDGPSPDPAGQG